MIAIPWTDSLFEFNIILLTHPLLIFSGESKSDSATAPSEVDQEQDKEGKAESRQTMDATGKQTQNFVKKNIEVSHMAVL